MIIPSSLLTSFLLRGLGIWVMASTLAESGKIPSEVKIWPQFFNVCYLKTNLSLFSLKFRSLHLCSNAIRFLSWSAKASSWVFPAPITNRSSAIAVTPSRPSMISFTCLWNSSGALHTLKGILCYLYLPKGVWKVVNLLESSSSFTYRNPSSASRTVNTCALASLEVTSSIVGRQCFGILTCLFNSLGSRQTRSWPLRFLTYTALLTQSVGSSIFAMCPFCSHKRSRCYGDTKKV